MRRNRTSSIDILGFNDQICQIGVIKKVGQLILDIAIVDIHPYCTNLEDRPQRLYPLDTIEGVDAHMITGLNSLCQQVVRQLIGPTIHFGESATGAFIHDVIAVWPFICGCFKEVGEVISRCWHMCVLAHRGR